MSTMRVVVCLLALVVLAGCGPLGGLALGTWLALEELEEGDVVPAITLGAIERSVGDVAIPVTAVGDGDVSLAVQYAVAGGPYAAATGASTEVPSSVGGRATTLTWDAASDLGAGYIEDVVVRVIPSQSDKTGDAAVSAPFVYGNDLPVLTNLDTGGTVRANAIISFDVADTAADDVDIVDFEWGVENFSTAYPIVLGGSATPAGTFSGLQTSTTGTTITFVWDSEVTLPAQDVYNVVMRLRVEDALGGVSEYAEVGPFNVNNGITGVSPTARIAGKSGDYVEIAYRLSDQNPGETVDIDVQYYGNGAWRLCTPHPTSSGTKDLQAGTAGTDHTFRWEPFKNGSIGGSSGLVRSYVDADGDGTTDTWMLDYTTDVAVRIVPYNTPPILTQGLAAEVLVDLGNTAPVATVDPIAVDQGRIVTVSLTLADTASDGLDLTVQYERADLPGLWFTATVLYAPASVTNLTSSPVGVYQAVLWNAEADLNDTTFRNNVRVRVAATDATIQSPWSDTGWFFDRQNSAPTAVFNTNPFPAGTYSGNVPVSLVVSDEESDLVLLALEYSTDSGSTWNTATLLGTGVVPGVPSPGVLANRFWNSVNDLPSSYVGPARLRVRGTDYEQGVWDTLSVDFDMDNSGVTNDPPEIQVSGTGVVQQGPGDWTMNVAPGSPLPGTVTLLATDPNSGNAITLTVTFNAVGSIGYTGVPAEIAATPSFVGGVATAVSSAPTPATVSLAPNGGLPTQGRIVFGLDADDGLGGSDFGTFEINVNGVPQIGAPTGPGTVTGGPTDFTSTVAAGTLLDFSVSVTDGSLSLLELTATVTDGSVLPGDAGFITTFPATVSGISSPQTLLITGTAMMVGFVELTFEADDGLGATSYITLTVTVEAGPAAEIEIVSGDNQRDRPGTTLTLPCVVRVTDLYANPVASEIVDFEALVGRGSVSSPTGMTDGFGETSVTWTLSRKRGLQTMRASLGVLDEVVFRATVPEFDFNGDGYSDLIVGAHLDDGGGVDAGAVYIFFGSSGGFPPMLDYTAADVTIAGNSSYDYFGVAVAGADVNHDFYDDLIAGAYGDDVGDQGRAYVLFGSANPVAVIADIYSEADVILEGAASGDNFGLAVAAGGDVNGDGVDDFIVGAWSSDSGATDSGSAYVYCGSATLPSLIPAASADVILTGSAEGDGFGVAVVVGLIDGDAYADVAVGARGSDMVGVDSGAAYIFCGGGLAGTVPAVNADVVIEAEMGGGQFGSDLTILNFRGDGYGDVAVGARWADKVYVFRGTDSLPSGWSAGTASVTVSGYAGGSYFGEVAGGEVNNDFCEDLLVGAPREDTSVVEGGTLNVYFGGDRIGVLNTADFRVLGSSTDGELGRGVGVLDYDRDGVGDFVVGVSGAGADRVRLFAGSGTLSGVSMENSATITVTGPFSVRFGLSIGP